MREDLPTDEGGIAHTPASTGKKRILFRFQGSNENLAAYASHPAWVSSPMVAIPLYSSTSRCTTLRERRVRRIHELSKAGSQDH